MNKYNENVPLSEIFNISPEDYANISVKELPLSVRVLRRLDHIKIYTVKDLVQTDISFLKNINGFGQNCLQNVISCCENLSQFLVNGSHSKIAKYKYPLLFIVNKQHIAAGDFSFAESSNLPTDQKILLDKLKESYTILGKELVFDCIYHTEIISSIILAFNQFFLKNELEEIIKQIPLFRNGNCAKYYIDAYSYDGLVRKELIGCYFDKDSELGSIIMSVPVDDQQKFSIAKRFLNWCTFDLIGDIIIIFDKLYSFPKVRNIIEARAGGQTLNEIGDRLNVTRERVRQLENKAKRNFSRLVAELNLIPKMFADLNGKKIVFLEDLEPFGGENTEALFFLLKGIESSTFTYDSLVDGLVFGDRDLPAKIQDYIDNLPEIVHKNEIEKIINTVCEKFGVENECVEKLFYDSYKTTGYLYHRTRLPLYKIYEAVVNKYYASGIHVHDEEEIENFRRHVHNDYGDIGLPENNRAIVGRIESICILGGRGIYIPKHEPLLSDELADDIYSYIVQSDRTVHFIGNIFSLFEERLEAEGVNNKYYMQGILHELYGDKLYFKRDYVSKDKEFTSIYSSIVEFIKESKYPVNKSELTDKFKGFTEIMLSIALSDSEILNFFGQYLHGSRIVIRETEKDCLFERLEALLSDNEAHHIKDIYSELKVEFPEIFSRNAVDNSYSAFSFLEYVFREQYQFSRPYIALNNVEIGRPNERLREIIYSQNEISVSDISDFVKENHMQIPSFIEYINSLNDKFLLTNLFTLMSIENIGINSDITAKIETLILEEIVDTVPIRDMTCVLKFPHINVPWDEWLVYSTIMKWGKRLEVALSFPQFRYSFPLIAPKGKMNTEKYKDIVSEPNHIKIDNMDDIDSLLGDILSEDLLEED